jgi:outer membrane lipopolysaccharide assembly protein LptE/RlpB
MKKTLFATKPLFLLLLVTQILSACGIYTFKDVSIPADVKTIRLHFIENKARYVNPALSPKLTNKLQDKIVGQTRLTRTDSEDADWVVSGYVSEYNVVTSGISSQQASTNRLTVGAHILLKDNKTGKDSEFDVTKSFEFSATQTIQQAEAQLGDQIVQGLSDEIFNRLFSNW